MFDFVDKWSNNPNVVKKIKEYLPSYLSQFDDVEKPIMCKLLENVEYYGENRIQDIIIEYFIYIEELIEIIGNHCEVCVPSKDNIINHNSYKILSYCPKTIKVINNVLNQNLNEIESLIIIDDYCGSGETICDFFDELNKKLLKTMKVYYFPVFIVDKTLQKLSKIKYVNLELKIINKITNNAECLSTNNIFNLAELKIFYDFCSDLKIAKEYVKGYGDIEDKFSTSYFTPNNSLGILWYEDRLYRPLFKRNGNVFKEQRYLSKKEMKEMNDLIIHTKDKERIDKSKIIFLLYKGFTIDEIRNYVNINNIKKEIQNLIKEKALVNQNDRYTFGVNIKEYFRVEKLNMHIEFGTYFTKRDEIENRLRSLINCDEN